MRVLVLGGTAEARDLAALLDEAGVDVVSSLAGRVARPRLPVGQVRVGGFGGVEAMAAYLYDQRVGAVVDATHPFAAQISDHAVRACELANAPLLRLERPGWGEHPAASSWSWVDDHAAAARAAAGGGRHVLLTTGRQPLPAFVGPLAEHRVVARVVDPPEITLPTPWRVLLDRGPYTVDGERALMDEHGTEVLVTKDSGGSYTAAKLDAAAERHCTVVVVRRPTWRGEGTFSRAGNADAALAWARSRSRH